MSQMTKCDEGHFYDKTQNTECPFCGVGEVNLTKKFNPDDAAEKTVRYSERGDNETRMYSTGAGPNGKPDASQRSQPSADPEKTMAVWSKGGGMDPVVGWLVCHEGPNLGRDYRIRSGYNTIGRDTSSQICIAGDDTIARIEHAKLFYDLKNASFHMIAGHGRSGVYVNNEVVLQSKVLKSYDVIEIGVTKLIFVPFCGDSFRWDTSPSSAARADPTKTGRAPPRSQGSVEPGPD